MPPLVIPRASTNDDHDAAPRLVLYYQTMHTHHGGPPASLLPLLASPHRVTHVILAALHIHADDPGRIRLNDNLPTDVLFDAMWAETAELRRRGGVRVLAMLGGAAPGSFSRDTLDAPSRAVFERYYHPLRDLLRRHALDGIDLDVEQEMSAPGIVRLIDALRADFGPAFLITLAPVAAAMVAAGNMSGFDYLDLEAARGGDIAWYNVQFYNNWGTLAMLPVMQALWPPRKLVLGFLTSPDNGNGFVPVEELRDTLAAMRATGVAHGGVMGWEYFNSRPGGKDAPWRWAHEVAQAIGTGPWPERKGEGKGAAAAGAVSGLEAKGSEPEDVSKTPSGVTGEDSDGEAVVPDAIEYHSDGGA